MFSIQKLHRKIFKLFFGPFKLCHNSINLNLLIASNTNYFGVQGQIIGKCQRIIVLDHFNHNSLHYDGLKNNNFQIKLKLLKRDNNFQIKLKLLKKDNNF
jgi:hypothetical protein